MSEKAFGIKKIEIKGSGIPTIDSPTDLYLNAVNVSISTDVTIGRNINVSGISTLGAGVTVTGTTFTNQLSVSGVSTFQNDIKVAEYSYGTNSNQITLGNNKFRIYSDSSNTYLKNYNTNSAGDLYIETDELLIRKYDGTETIAQFTEGAGVKLNYQGINKFETLGTGVTVTGTTFTNQLSVSGIATIGPVATGTTSLYLGGPLKVGEIDISGGSNSVHVGQGAGRKNYNGGSGQQNTAVGYNALGVNQASNFNTAFGISALGSLGDTAFSNYDANTAIGAYAGSSLLTGINNTFLGRSAGSSITSGSSNTILGMYNGNSGGLDIRTSSNNVVLSDGSGNIRLYANSSGNVGLGTTNPTSKLSVNGGIQLAQNNETIVGTSGTTGEIKRIGGAPFFYDGSAWREFVLSSGTPVSVPADTEWDNVILRSTFDTNFDDVRFNVSPTVSSGSTITQSAVKIGTGSLRLQNGYLTYPHRSEYNFTGEWTIEGWFYIDTLPSSTGTESDVIFSKGNSGTSGNNFALGLEYSGISNLYNFYWKNNASTTHNGARGTVIAQYAGTNLIKQWIHIALVREPSNGSIHFYLNGIEHGSTASNAVIDNDISNTPTNDMYLGYYQDFTDSRNFDGYVDDFRISTVARYTSVGITTTTFTPPTTALPTTGTLSSYIQPPADKYGEITLGVSPTWRGTSGVTVLRQASGNYRVSFASSYTNSNDYYVLSQGMDQGFASYVGIARSTTHVDISINRLDNDATIDSGSLSVQIKNHI